MIQEIYELIVFSQPAFPSESPELWAEFTKRLTDVGDRLKAPVVPETPSEVRGIFLVSDQLEAAANHCEEAFREYLNSAWLIRRYGIPRDTNDFVDAMLLRTKPLPTVDGRLRPLSDVWDEFRIRRHEALAASDDLRKAYLSQVLNA